MLGESVTIRKLSNRVVVTNRPARKRGEPSEKAALYQERFREATQYANLQMEREESRALYARGADKQKKITPFIVALTDYIKPPKVTAIDTSGFFGRVGDVIVVKATDDFMVTKVKVTLRNKAGDLIEEGEATAVPDMVNTWSFRTTVAIKSLAGTAIRALAYDRPGNVGSMEVVVV